MDNQRPQLDLKFCKDICPDQNVPVIVLFAGMRGEPDRTEPDRASGGSASPRRECTQSLIFGLGRCTATLPSPFPLLLFTIARIHPQIKPEREPEVTRRLDEYSITFYHLPHFIIPRLSSQFRPPSILRYDYCLGFMITQLNCESMTYLLSDALRSD